MSSDVFFDLLSFFSWCSRVADEISVSRGPFRISLSWSSDRCVVCWRDVFRGPLVWKFLVSRGWLGTSRTDLLTPRIFFDEALKSCWRRCCRRRPRVVLAVVLLVVDFRIRVVSLSGLASRSAGPVVPRSSFGRVPKRPQTAPGLPEARNARFLKGI